MTKAKKVVEEAAVETKAVASPESNRQVKVAITVGDQAFDFQGQWRDVDGPTIQFRDAQWARNPQTREPKDFPLLQDVLDEKRSIHVLCVTAVGEVLLDEEVKLTGKKHNFQGTLDFEFTTLS